MAIDKYVRAHTREELREVAKLAQAAPAPAPFRAPYTSGYVDLTPYAAPPESEAPGVSPAGLLGVTADPSLLTMSSGQVTMAPVSLSALVSSDEPETVVSARRRRRTVVVAAVTGVLCAGLALGAVVKHVVVARRAERASAAPAVAPPPAIAPAGSVAAAAPPATVAAAVTPPPAEAAKAPSGAEAAKAPSGADASPAPHKKVAHGHAPQAHASAGARAVPAAARLSKSAGGSSDPLMDAMRQSVAGARP